MANISNTIEKFIVSSIDESGYVDISRNSLAEYFSCAPSQINYVLDTRFTVDKGYAKESKRGGSGYIRITKIQSSDANSYLNGLIHGSIGEEISEKRMIQILDKLEGDKIMSDSERAMVCVALSDDSLAMPFTIKDRVRAKAFKNVLTKLMIKS